MLRQVSDHFMEEVYFGELSELRKERPDHTQSAANHARQVERPSCRTHHTVNTDSNVFQAVRLRLQAEADDTYL
jgi:hypothetical protein